MKAGIIPWKMEWDKHAGMPENFVSKTHYHGINFLQLVAAGYSSKYWMTFNQCKSKGGSIKSGEHGLPVTFWKLWNPKTRQEEDITDETAKNPNGIPVLRYYTVFNILQTTIEPPETDKKQHEPIPEAEAIIAGYSTKPEIKHEEPRAYYSKTNDYINMPKPETFTKPEAYYSTLFHEMTHSTGHASRLSRFSDTETVAFGSESYSNEELIAEMGAAFLSAECGISPAVLDNQAAYIQGWITRLKNDPKLLIQAAGKATKAAAYITGKGGK